MIKFPGVFTFTFLCFFCYSAIAQSPVSSNGKSVKINGKRIYYEETGSGRPLILLHGFGRTADDWKFAIPELSKTNRVITVDLPGHGRSDLIDSTNSYLHKQAASYIIGLIETLKLDTVQMMGFSSGAIITLYISCLRPELTSKIIVVAGQLYFSEATRKFISGLGGPQNFINDSTELIALHGRKGKLIAEQFWHFRKLTGDPSITPDLLSLVTAKTLIVHGDDDPAAPVDNAFMMYRHIRNAHLSVLPFAGHVGFFESRYQQEFIKQVTEFLKSK